MSSVGNLHGNVSKPVVSGAEAVACWFPSRSDRCKWRVSNGLGYSASASAVRLPSPGQSRGISIAQHLLLPWGMQFGRQMRTASPHDAWAQRPNRLGCVSCAPANTGAYTSAAARQLEARQVCQRQHYIAAPFPVGDRGAGRPLEWASAVV